MNIKELSIIGVLAFLLVLTIPQTSYAEAIEGDSASGEIRDQNGFGGFRGGKHKGEVDRKGRKERMKERMKNMPPEAQEELKANRERLHEMSKEERRAFMKDFRERHNIKRHKGKRGEKWQKRREEMREQLKDLPPEERKAKMQEFRKKFKSDHKEKMKKRWENASPEKRKHFCKKARERCSENDRPMACEMVKTKCSNI